MNEFIEKKWLHFDKDAGGIPLIRLALLQLALEGVEVITTLDFKKKFFPCWTLEEVNKWLRCSANYYFRFEKDQYKKLIRKINCVYAGGEYLEGEVAFEIDTDEGWTFVDEFVHKGLANCDGHLYCINCYEQIKRVNGNQKYCKVCSQYAKKHHTRERVSKFRSVTRK